MAVLYIKEYSNLAMASQGLMQIPDEGSLVAEQTLAIGGSSVASSAFNAKTKFVRLIADSVCAISFGAAPTAATASGTGTASGTSDRLAQNTPEYRGVERLLGGKVAVISTS